MSVPFSNTSLRIPRGFGNLLEGLAREVLRDQPEDIPTFAAHYFTGLLKSREESGLDPAEWGAKLEDRFYNNHSFKGTAIQGNTISPETNKRNNAGRSKTFGNSETLHSELQHLKFNSEDNEIKENYDINKTLDEESGEKEQKLDAEIPHVGTADVDICAQEQKDPSEFPEETPEVLKDNKVTKEAVDTDICRSEIKPTPLPSFGGLANVDVCDEEINQPFESDENKRDPESPKFLPPEQSQDGSFDEIPSQIQRDVTKQVDEISDDDDDDDYDNDSHTEDAEQGVSEMADSFLEDPGPAERSTDQVYVEESTESTFEKDISESAAEAGLESDEPDNEDQEETSHVYRSINDFEEAAADSTSDINSKSLMEMKNAYIDYSDETNESKSEVIDVLEEIHHQYATHTDEHEDETSADEENTSKIVDSFKEEDLLETPKPVSHLNDSETEVIEDMRSNEIFDTDVMEASENDLNTENINEGSDLESDAEEMDPDILNMLQPSTVNTEDNEDDGTHGAEAMDEFLPSKAEEADSGPLETEHPPEIQEQTESTENDADLEDQLEEQRDESQELTLKSEILEGTDSSEPKEECSQPQEEEDIMDIPLDDPEANKAAAKIQAGFRGHMTRKKMKPGEKPSEEVSSSGEALNGSQGDSAGGTDGVETEATSGPEQ